MPAYQVNIPISNVFWNPPIVAGAPNVRGYNIIVGNNFIIDLYNIQQDVLASQRAAQHGHLQNPTPDLPAYQVNISISDIFWDLQIVAGAQMLGYNVIVLGIVVSNNSAIDLYNIQQEVLASQIV
nr:9390_t:CDS:2 [Entrophospora candida]